MIKKIATLLFAAFTALGASAQSDKINEVPGGVDFRSVYNMGAKNNYSKISVQARGGVNHLQYTWTDGDGYFKAKDWRGQFGISAEYTFTQFWGLGIEYNWLDNNTDRYNNIINAFGVYASINAANLLAPQRRWKKINAYANFGVGMPFTKWSDAFYYEEDANGKKEKKDYEDGSMLANPYIKPGLQVEYNFDDNLSFGVFFDYLYDLGRQQDVPGSGQIHPTTFGGQGYFVPGISCRYKFAGHRHIRNSNIKEQIDYSLDIKDQLTLINRQARRIDSLAQVSEAEIANLRAENEQLRRTMKQQQDSLDKVAKRALEVERRVINPTEDESKLIKASLSDLRFETGKAIIKVESYPSLDQLAELIKAHNEWNVMLSGYTDNAGDPQKNLILSRDRAAAVKDYLVKKGVDAGCIQSVGYGDKDPIAPNNTPVGRAKNRRVELELYTRQ